MSLIVSRVRSALPPKQKMTSGGWLAVNAPCCHHRGESHDTKMRGGFMFSGEGWTFNCFNCHFKAGWSPGKLISKNSQLLMSWLGISPDEIKELMLVALKQRDDVAPKSKILSFDLETKELPAQCLPITTWLNEGCTDPRFIEVIEYLLNRGMKLEWCDWHWCLEPGYIDRVIIPFYYKNKIVGWTARKIKEGKPKYLAHSQAGYVYNLDNQSYDRTCVIVVEGHFDAIAIDAVAIGTNDITPTQVFRLNQLGKEVIIVPDKDKAGASMLQPAIDNNWSVSLPEWGNDVKDVADAVKKYGRIYTLFTILKYREHGEIKITMLKKKLERINE